MPDPALQGIAVAWNHIATSEANGDLSVNLLLSYQDDAVEIISHLPQAGHVTVKLKMPLPKLRIRVPTGCDRRSLNVQINNQATPFEYAEDYLKLSAVATGVQIDMTFEQTEFFTQERALGHTEPFRVAWRGNTVLAISGTTPHMPLYPALAE
jgi:hypothetical protein